MKGITIPATLEDVVRVMNENNRRGEENFKTIAKDIYMMSEEIEKLKGRCRILGVII